jgi:RNA polymerase sigma factor (sigma-70 family)
MQDSIVFERDNEIEQLYREQAQRLWRALYAFSADPECASDAVSEAFARALEHERAIRDLSAWVWRVAFRVAAAEMKGRRRTAVEIPLMRYEVPDPVPELMTALRQLSPNQRLAVVLHDYADRPTVEVAALLGSSRATVHVHLAQGRRRLRKLMEESDA